MRHTSHISCVHKNTVVGEIWCSFLSTHAFLLVNGQTYATRGVPYYRVSRIFMSRIFSVPLDASPSFTQTPLLGHFSLYRRKKCWLPAFPAHVLTFRGMSACLYVCWLVVGVGSSMILAKTDEPIDMPLNRGADFHVGVYWRYVANTIDQYLRRFIHHIAIYFRDST